MKCKPFTLYFFFILALIIPSLQAELSVPSVFSNQMVLQRNIKNKVWGWANPGESISVSINGQTKTTEVNEDKRWSLHLDPLKAGGPYELVIKTKQSSLTFTDVLVGEVWLCSGQSNMQWPLNASRDADIELAISQKPNIRILSVPNIPADTPQDNFKGSWQPSTNKESLKHFSAVGYYFGKIVYEALDVPVGLINCSWGGSAAEAWVPRHLLEDDPIYAHYMNEWREKEQEPYDEAAEQKKFDEKIKQWQEAVKEAKRLNTIAPPRPWQVPTNPLKSQKRPANIYNGMLSPIIGYGMRGTIWYQGETNMWRGYQYRHLFPLLIETWRKEWEIGDFPFYWAQLTRFHGSDQNVLGESKWAEVRESQTLTLSLPNTGQANIIDLGERNDIHPQNKYDVAKRLARIALANDYGFKNIATEYPTFVSSKIVDGKMEIKFKNTGKKLQVWDDWTVKGFMIAGKDQKFVRAKAKIILKDTVSVWSDDIKEPVAVRYAWEDNPHCNLYNDLLMPALPFRTDTFKLSSQTE